jgi:hypothetical protein
MAGVGLSDSAVLQQRSRDPSWWMSNRNFAFAPRIRKDGWTPERQLRFLDALVQTRNVVKAAALAGMSRESAYRLRERREGALFGLLWDRALAPEPYEVHSEPMTDGRLMRLLGTNFRRDRGDFLNMGSRRQDSEGGDRTTRL